MGWPTLLRRGRGIGGNRRINPIAKQIGHARQPAMRSADKEQDRVPIARDANGRVHVGASPGALKGNKYAFKHGRHSNEAIATCPRTLRCL